MHDTLSIRTAQSADLSEIDALLSRSYPALLKGHYPPSTLVTAVPLLAKAQPRLLTTGTYFVVTKDNGRIVAAGGWTKAAPGTGRRGAPFTGHIRHVVTDHREVRQGIGRALMGHVFDTARAAGMKRLDCLSTQMAVAFYAACGFDEVGPVSIYLRPGIEFSAVLMQRTL